MISEEQTSAGNSDVEIKIKQMELEHQAHEQQRKQEWWVKIRVARKGTTNEG